MDFTANKTEENGLMATPKHTHPVKKETFDEREINDLSEENEKLRAVVAEMVNDLRIVKKSIVDVITGLGMMNPDGTIRQSLDFVKVMGVVRTLFDKKSKLKDDFASLQNLIPLVAKYEKL